MDGQAGRYAKRASWSWGLHGTSLGRADWVGQGFGDEVIGIYLSGDSSLSIARIWVSGLGKSRIHPNFGWIHPYQIGWQHLSSPTPQHNGSFY